MPLWRQAPQRLDWQPAVGLADEALYEVKRGGRNGACAIVASERPVPPPEVPAARLLGEGWLRLHPLPRHG